VVKGIGSLIYLIGKTHDLKLLTTISIAALALLFKRLVVRRLPSRPYRLQKDEWSKIRGYRRPY
jgi:hypothetical protein